MDDYEKTYGISIHHDKKGLKLKFVTNSSANENRKGYKSKDPRFRAGDDAPAANVGSRVYVLAGYGGGGTYEMWQMKNKEFSFEVDVSQLPCGLNGALYFVEMAEDGGKSEDGNSAGGAYGTGYCDAQCPHDIKFIAGEANNVGWEPSASDPSSGTGKYGACCTELDVWEANSMANALTPHTCDKNITGGAARCEGAECGDTVDDDPESRYSGWCDKDGYEQHKAQTTSRSPFPAQRSVSHNIPPHPPLLSPLLFYLPLVRACPPHCPPVHSLWLGSCDFNPYRLGETKFYGPGADYEIDTTQPFTVVTQVRVCVRAWEGRAIYFLF